MVTLLWAMWDEGWGQRPWKSYQGEFKTRYLAFLKTARTKSATSVDEVKKNPEYASLQQNYEGTSAQAKPRLALLL